MTWTRKKIGAAVLAAAALLGGAGMYYGGPTSSTHAPVTSYAVHSG